MRRLWVGFLILAILSPFLIYPSPAEATLADSPWPMFQKDAQHSGQSAYPGPGPSAIVKWTFDTGGPIYSSPVLGADGTIYIGSDSGKLFALKPDGSKKWEYAAGGVIHSVPAIGDDGKIYFGFLPSDNSNDFIVLNPDGSQKTSWGKFGGVVSSPCMDVTHVYFGTGDGWLVAEQISLEAEVGGWAYPTGGTIPSSPVLPPDGNFVIFCFNDTRGQGTLRALQKPAPLETEWHVLWSVGFGSPIYSSPSVCKKSLPGEPTIFIGASHGWIYAFGENGKLKWQDRAGDSISSTPAISQDGSTVYVGSYVGSDKGKLMAFDRKTGVTKWEFPTNGPIYSSPCIDVNGVIYFGCLDSKVYALNPDGTKKWELATGGPVYSSLCIGSDGTLYVGSTDNKLYAITGLNVPTEYPTITPPPTVHLIYPSGGETLTGNASFTIKWSPEYPPSGPHFWVLSYSLDGGATWSKIAEVSNTDNLPWTVPNVNTTRARVRITWMAGTPDSPGSRLAQDESGDFTIVLSSVSPTPSLSFPDVPSGYWAYGEIMDLVGAGVINGYPDGTFKPEFPVTRAEFAKMALLSLGYALEFPDTPSFPDLEKGEWYYGYVEGAAKHGLVKGYPDGTFQPQGNVTIAEILTVIVRAKGWEETAPPGPPPFILLHDRDDSVRAITAEDWYYGTVGAAAQNGLLLFPDYKQITVAGAESGEYEVRFNTAATRAQTAVFLARMRGL